VTEKRSRVITLNILGVLLFVIFGLIFSSLAVSLGKLPSQGEYGLSEIGLAFVGILLTFVLHELTHGLVMRIFGARPKYGILWKGMMFYATSPGYAYHRNNYVVIALAPFVFISILVVLGMWLLQGTLWVALLGICGIINASGAIGDMGITRIVLRYATTAFIMDERDGIRVFLPKP
jgi:sterol desaturase/sphingolipid hydroxylase (fatty acid hydroxylase superfamily)